MKVEVVFNDGFVYILTSELSLVLIGSKGEYEGLSLQERRSLLVACWLDWEKWLDLTMN